MIWIQGTVEDTEIVSETDYDSICATISTRDGDWYSTLQWSAFDDLSKFEEVVGHYVAICGIFSGYSDIEGMPTILAVKLFDGITGEVLYGVGDLILSNYYDEEDEPMDDDNANDGKDDPLATSDQAEALDRALSYLSSSDFSYNGLVEQLEYEGFSHEDAVYAADNCGADWNEQALRSAQSYIEYSAFSYLGLLGQLEYEEFTDEQAKYGADNCGADWNQEAVDCARSYLDFMSFTREDLIYQLEFEGFTHEQAVYGVEANGL